MKLIDDVVYEADCQMITEGAVNVDIGANASAEEEDEGVDDQAVKVNNIIHSFRLSATAFEKKDYLTYLKGYMKAIKKQLQDSGKSQEEITAFETGVQSYLKSKVLSSFKDWEFFTGESMNPEGMVVLLNYREDGVTPYVVAWKHGLKEVKV